LSGMIPFAPGETDLCLGKNIDLSGYGL